MWLKVGNNRLPGEGDGETGGHGSSYNTIPRAVFVLSAALLVMRSAQTFYVPILPLYIRILDTSIPLFVVGLVAGVHGHFRAEGIGAAGCFRWTYGRGGLDWCPRLPQRPYQLRGHRHPVEPDFPFRCNRAKSKPCRTEREIRR